MAVSTEANIKYAKLTGVEIDRSASEEFARAFNNGSEFFLNSIMVKQAKFGAEKLTGRLLPDGVKNNLQKLQDAAKKSASKAAGAAGDTLDENAENPSGLFEWLKPLIEAAQSAFARGKELWSKGVDAASEQAVSAGIENNIQKSMTDTASLLEENEAFQDEVNLTADALNVPDEELQAIILEPLTKSNLFDLVKSGTLLHENALHSVDQLLEQVTGGKGKKFNDQAIISDDIGNRMYDHILVESFALIKTHNAKLPEEEQLSEGAMLAQAAGTASRFSGREPNDEGSALVKSKTHVGVMGAFEQVFVAKKNNQVIEALDLNAKSFPSGSEEDIKQLITASETSEPVENTEAEIEEEQKSDQDNAPEDVSEEVADAATQAAVTENPVTADEVTEEVGDLTADVTPPLKQDNSPPSQKPAKTAGGKQ